MGDCCIKENFDFGAESVATTTTTPTTEVTTIDMLAYENKHSTQSQQHRIEEMNECKVLEQQVLRGAEAIAEAALAAEKAKEKEEEEEKQQQQQDMQTNIVMKTKVTEKCGMDVVVKNAEKEKQKHSDENGVHGDGDHHHHHHHHRHMGEQNTIMVVSHENGDEENSCSNNDGEEVLNTDEGPTSQGDDEDDIDGDSDDSTSDSNFSDISGLSEVSGKEWKPISARPLQWVQKQIHNGANPREILSQILPNAHHLPPGMNDMALWRLLASVLSEPPRRQKLRNVNTFADVVRLVKQSRNIMVLTGAGVSVSCGIPDFRSSDGIYSRLAKDYPDLPDPQAMFDINYFSRDPRPFYKFAREIYPGQFKPSPCHRFIKLLEDKNKLLRNYTQNIDTLEQVAGIKNVIECHGSFSTASCTKCKHKCDADAIRADIFAQRIPVCPKCQPNVQQSVDASEPVSSFELRQLVENGIMKPDIVFFGEGLPEEFHTVMASDKDKCDLLIVIGSSLKVRPVALIPSSIPPNVPQILINREQLHHLEFDVELLGDSDVIINQLCHCLGNDWKEICYDETVLKECKELISYKNQYDEEDSQDNDTQSLESNTSNDLQNPVGNAGIYTDSGFESSASSTTNNVIIEHHHHHNHNHRNIIMNGGGSKVNRECSAGAIVLTKPPQQQLPPELIEGPNECHSFAERLAEPLPSSEESPLPSSSSLVNGLRENYRHFSVDSTKDSGIGQYCGESSNSSALTPPLPHTSEAKQSNPYDHHHGSSTSLTTTTPTNMTPTISSNNKMAMAGSKPKRKDSRTITLTAADRLPFGCYYSHERTSSYVFPGAQVSWCSESEEDDLEELEENLDDEEAEEEEDEEEDNQDENDYCAEENCNEEADDDDDADDEEDEQEEEEEDVDDDEEEDDNNDDDVDDDLRSAEEIHEKIVTNDPKTNTSCITTSSFLKRHSNGLDVEVSESLSITSKIGSSSSELLSPPPNKKSRSSFESTSATTTTNRSNPADSSLEASAAPSNNSNFCLTNNSSTGTSTSSSTTTPDPLTNPHY